MSSLWEEMLHPDTLPWQKGDLFPLNLTIGHSAVSHVIIFLTWIDPLDPWSLTLPSYSGLPSGLGTLSSFSDSLSHPNLLQPSIHRNEMHIVPHITKKNISVLIAISLQCLWYLCDDLFWLSTFEKVNTLKLWRWFCLKLPCFFLLSFPKVSWVYIPRDLKVTEARLVRTLGPISHGGQLTSFSCIPFLQNT